MTDRKTATEHRHDNRKAGERFAQATGPLQTVDEYLAAGGKITRCPEAPRNELSPSDPRKQAAAKAD